jgi:hypothetical protein
MRFVFGLLACAAMNIALADDPPAPPANAPAATAQAPASTAQPTAAAPSAAQPAADAAAAQADAQEKHFVSEGYSVEMHHGNKMFCRREDQLGSRLGAKKYCSTGEQLAETERQAQRSMDPATWQKSNPSGK